ncbi:MAG: (2Fe-2S) ferredoxin domain-containing protein [Ruminococcus sp.]|nr:(2Fe-2S) ferredoxin domain-containing protein [Ruminococcus sp.]
MKSLAELKAIRDRAKAQLDLRKENPNAARVLVGMATCGIAAGARPVLNAFTEEIAKRGLTESVTVTQTGCIGICQYEPVVEIEIPGEEKVTYVKVAPEMVPRIVNDHLVNHNVVTEFTIGAIQK